jgi:hypothetical protein
MAVNGRTSSQDELQTLDKRRAAIELGLALKSILASDEGNARLDIVRKAGEQGFFRVPYLINDIDGVFERKSEGEGQSPSSFRSRKAVGQGKVISSMTATS